MHSGLRASQSVSGSNPTVRYSCFSPLAGWCWQCESQQEQGLALSSCYSTLAGAQCCAQADDSHTFPVEHFMSTVPFSSVTYCGHSALLLQSQSNDPYTLAIDPWLSGNPLCPENLVNPNRLDCIVLTHGHSDHAGDAVRLGKHYGSQLVATYELAMLLIDDGYPEEKVTPMNKGGTVVVADRYRVTLTHALHSSSYEGSKGTMYAGEACGVVVRDGKNSFYHAGDTALFSDMALIKASYAPTYAFIPCGDCFTMGPVEAAQAAALIGAQHTIPIHHSTFPLLTGDPHVFVAECRNRGLQAAILEPGQSLAL